ncbi:hypothetical protein NDU88_005778 [Pleurodeles waltl]|uniref:Uncharacterized protein n=1 Tax=Pleurodeles waltl TaxID=8319 RepID=A0AAV7WEC1_PLEWA|nr:hypothetical protein NDU88_005778 [Pleurodeles waltl]
MRAGLSWPRTSEPAAASGPHRSFTTPLRGGIGCRDALLPDLGPADGRVVRLSGHVVVNRLKSTAFKMMLVEKALEWLKL